VVFLNSLFVADGPTD
jgi:hypothetical protein